MSDFIIAKNTTNLQNRITQFMNAAYQLLTRREFTKTTLLAGAALASGAVSAVGQDAKRIRTGLIGCGSVSGSYLPVLTKCPSVEVVSLCDIRPERARQRAEQFKVAHHYPHIDQTIRPDCHQHTTTNDR